MRRNFVHFNRAAGKRCESVDFVGVAFKHRQIMMADHDHLKPERAAGFLDNFHELRNQIGTKPAILLVENQKPSMPGGVERRQREQAKADTQDIRDGTSLAAVDILAIPLALDPEIDGRRAAFEIGIRPEPDRLLENFLQGDRDFFFHHMQQIFEEALAELFQSARHAIGDG